MFAAAFLGFLLADATLIFAAGLLALRRFFVAHGAAVTRLVGAMGAWRRWCHKLR